MCGLILFATERRKTTIPKLLMRPTNALRISSHKPCLDTLFQLHSILPVHLIKEERLRLLIQFYNYSVVEVCTLGIGEKSSRQKSIIPGNRSRERVGSQRHPENSSQEPRTFELPRRIDGESYQKPIAKHSRNTATYVLGQGARVLAIDRDSKACRPRNPSHY